VDNMTKKQNTMAGLAGLIIGIVGGIAGTAFSMGADKQKINDILSHHSARMDMIADQETIHEHEVQKELDRFSVIIASQISQLQSSVSDLTETVSQLRIDVQVVKALVERVENDLISNKSPN